MGSLEFRTVINPYVDSSGQILDTYCPTCFPCHSDKFLHSKPTYQSCRKDLCGKMKSQQNAAILCFLPPPGEMIQFDEHIFQMGWFNHRLALP